MAKTPLVAVARIDTMYFPLLFYTETFFGTQFKAIGDKLKPNERSVIIMNHRTRLDWLFFIACLLRHTRASNLKIVLKSQLRSAPCIGRSKINDPLMLNCLIYYFAPILIFVFTFKMHTCMLIRYLAIKICN